MREIGVRRGDRILLMLGNVAPLWECMLAAMKLGAVIVPATTLLTRNDLSDRFARGQVRHVIANAEAAAKFADLPGDYTRTLQASVIHLGSGVEQNPANNTATITSILRIH